MRNIARCARTSKHKISPVGTALTEKSLMRDLKVLGGKELNVKYLEIHLKGDIKEETIKSLDGNIDRSSRIINIITTNKKVMKITKPYEVNQAIRTWLYLRDRKLPFDVSGVMSGFTIKWIISGNIWALISKTEFEKLFKEVYKPDLSEEQLIAQLSELWISKTNYQKWWEDE